MAFVGFRGVGAPPEKDEDRWLNLQEQWVETTFGRDFIGYAVDVGANNGIFLSNTLDAEMRGWTVLCIEANPDYEAELRGCRRLVEMCACADFMSDSEPFYVNTDTPASDSALVRNSGYDREHVVSVPVCTLDSLLEKHEFPKLDLLSVDVEHTELKVLAGFDFTRWKPRGLLIESLTREEEMAIFERVRPFGYRKDIRLTTDVAYLLR